MSIAINLMEKGLIPEALIRYGIRREVLNRLNLEKNKVKKLYDDSIKSFSNMLRKDPIAIETNAANDQHYMVPPEFFELCLGKHLKYSCCYFKDGVKNLDQAEKDSIEQVAIRAKINDGQNILELGCGWGSFSLWIARNYPNAKITSVSNSSSQREYIENIISKENLTNIKVITADINNFKTDEKFERVVSIEMFEHMRNYELLLKKISDILKDDGKLFVHVFSHKELAYLFESDKSWMAKYFFTGGLMPSHNLFGEFQDDLVIENSWKLNGVHYQKTAEAWANNLKHNKHKILKILQNTYGKKNAKITYNRWHTFFLACAELFGYANGSEWGVSHYLFEKIKKQNKVDE